MQSTLWQKIYAWLDERLGLDNMYTGLLDRPEPLGMMIL